MENDSCVCASWLCGDSDGPSSVECRSAVNERDVRYEQPCVLRERDGHDAFVPRRDDLARLALQCALEFKLRIIFEEDCERSLVVVVQVD